MSTSYLATRDSCIDRKAKKQGFPCSRKQVQDCRKMAAIWYYDRFGKPVSDTDSKAQLYDVTDIYQDINHKQSIVDTIDDNVANLTIAEDNKFFVSIPIPIVTQDEFYFTQPFDKSESNYRESVLTPEWHIVENSCAFCIHRVSSSPNITNWDNSFCHLVQGLIDENFVCDYFADSLIKSNNDQVD